jgi:hypothetical protein
VKRKYLYLCDLEKLSACKIGLGLLIGVVPVVFRIEVVTQLLNAIEILIAVVGDAEIFDAPPKPAEVIQIVRNRPLYQ